MITASAEISQCGQYRYELTRRWSLEEKAPAVMWIMLNPSTADGLQDDPTIRRCIAFSNSWGYGAIKVYNIFALRATNPSALLEHPDPIGPNNRATISMAMADADVNQAPIVCAWGAFPAVARLNPPLPTRGFCLGTTADGSPRHPLYVKGTTAMQPWKGQP